MNLTGQPPRQKPPKPGKNPEYLAKVAALPCVICHTHGERQIGRTYVHHVICGRHGGAKTPDKMAIPLCYRHHQGEFGIHTERAAWVEAYGPDTDYVDPTRNMIARYVTHSGCARA